MKAILVNYNYDPTWLKDYPDLEVRLYDRTDTGFNVDLTQYGETYLTKNWGDVDYDKLSYLVEKYKIICLRFNQVNTILVTLTHS